MVKFVADIAPNFSKINHLAWKIGGRWSHILVQIYFLDTPDQSYTFFKCQKGSNLNQSELKEILQSAKLGALARLPNIGMRTRPY